MKTPKIDWHVAHDVWELDIRDDHDPTKWTNRAYVLDSVKSARLLMKDVFHGVRLIKRSDYRYSSEGGKFQLTIGVVYKLEARK